MNPGQRLAAGGQFKLPLQSAQERHRIARQVVEVGRRHRQPALLGVE